MLAARRDLGAPLAGKSTLNQLELMPAGAPHAERYHKITYSAEALEALLVDLFVETHQRAPREIVVDLDARKHVFSTATTGTTATCRCTCSAEIICCARRLRPSNQDATAGNLDSLTDISDLLALSIDEAITTEQPRDHCTPPTFS